jgi:hypothetical protein
MKKLLLVLLALTVLGVMAFADDVTWTYGATIKTGAQITVPSDGAIGARVYDADDSVASRVRFDAEAALGDFSAHIRVGGDFAGYIDFGSFGAGTGPAADTYGTFLNAWWVTGKFFDKMLEVRAGNIDNSVTDTVNNGWGGSSVEGVQFVVAPISGLSIAYGLPLNADVNTFNANVAMSKVGFAYSMPNLATVKFTYVNGRGDKTSSVYGGVRILAVPNLTADLEFQAANLGNKAVALANIELFENAQYAMGAFAPGIVVDEVLYNDSANKMQLYVKPYVDYTVSDTLMVGGNVKFTNNAGGVDKLQSLGIDPYVKFIFNSKAALKTDFAFSIPDLTDTATWTMPININFMWSF